MYMEEHNVLRSLRSGFCVYDSRGFDYDMVNQGLEELSSWMTEGVHHNQLCQISDEYGTIVKNQSEVDSLRQCSKFVQRKVNCVMVVVNIAEISRDLKAANPKSLEAITQLFCSPDLRKCSEFAYIQIEALLCSFCLDALYTIICHDSIWLQMRIQY